MVDNCNKRSEKMEEIVGKIEKEFHVTADELKNLADEIEKSMQMGLKDEKSSCIKMLVTFVQSLPSGNETGCFYALDLGGTNLRVMQVKLEGNKNKVDVKANSFVVPPELKVGKLHDLFDYIAGKVDEFVGPNKETIRELGFTFSFPVCQTKINSGTLMNWTKDFNIQDSIGKDMVQELTKALQKKQLKIEVTALLNDTVGTLAGGRFQDENVAAAVILGTGMNAAYVEKVEDIPKLGQYSSKSGQMVINTELGNFGGSSLPTTKYDRDLDDDSPNQTMQLLEKRLSGRYLGEIVRRVLLQLAENDGLFGEVPSKLRKHNVLGTDIVSIMHNDKSAELMVVGKNLDDVLEIKNVCLEDKKLVVKICEIVATRGARLSAAAILAILKRMGKDKVTEGKTVIAVDGSLFGKYEQFKSCLQKTLKEELLEMEVSKTVFLEQYNDASGVGAALIAASHSK